jgi:hypothetical protein
MNNYYVTNLMVALVCISLSGCQTNFKPEPMVEQTDPDIVVMPGFGGSAAEEMH